MRACGAWTLSHILLLGMIVASFGANAKTFKSRLKASCERPKSLFARDQHGFRVDYFRYVAEENIKDGKLLLIIPPIGGVNFIDHNYAKKFCKAGYAALILRSYTGSSEQAIDLGVHERVISKAVRAVRMIRHVYPHKFFGILGTSAGGIVASTLVDDFANDLDAIFTIVAGAPLHSVIARAGTEELKDLRELRMAKMGFRSIDEYERALKESLEVFTPRNIPPGIDVGTVIATRDDVVPTRFQQELAQWWRPTKKLEFRRGHTTAIVVVASQHGSSILNFFNSAAKKRGF